MSSDEMPIANAALLLMLNVTGNADSDANNVNDDACG